MTLTQKNTYKAEAEPLWAFFICLINMIDRKEKEGKGELEHRVEEASKEDLKSN